MLTLDGDDMNLCNPFINADVTLFHDGCRLRRPVLSCPNQSFVIAPATPPVGVASTPEERVNAHFEAPFPPLKWFCNMMIQKLTMYRLMPLMKHNVLCLMPPFLSAPSPLPLTPSR